MNILRRQETSIESTADFQIGDQIRLGKYTATCQAVTNKAAIFLLDQYLDKAYRMNPTDTNRGGYARSELRHRIGNAGFVAKDDNFRAVRGRLIPFQNGDLLRIPTVGEIFGDDPFYERDGHKQWELMKKRCNRITERDEGEEYEHGWLWNKVQHGDAKSFFAAVSYNGDTECETATEIGGVRPVFQLAF